MTAAPRQEAPKTRTLASIVEEMLAVIEDAGGEVTARIDELGLELSAKVQAYAAVCRQLDAEATAYTDLAQNYKEQANRRELQITALKFRLDAALQSVGLDKVRTPTATAFYAHTKSVAIENEAAFLESAPDRFVTVKSYPNKTAVKEALEAGEVVQGAEMKTSRHLRLR